DPDSLPLPLPLPLILAFDLALDIRGPSVAAESAGKNPQGAAHGCAAFSAGAGCPLGCPADSADPVRSIGRAGGMCFLCARFPCTSKERWLAPSRRESS